MERRFWFLAAWVTLLSLATIFAIWTKSPVLSAGVPADFSRASEPDSAGRVGREDSNAATQAPQVYSKVHGEQRTQADDVAAIDEAASSEMLGLSEEREAEIVAEPLEPPRPEQMREELRQDPHGVPPSLSRFAAVLGIKVSAALSSSDSASAFMGELERCTAGSTGQETASVAAVCLLGARTLEKRFPELETRYRNLKTRANPRAVSLASSQ